MLKESAKEWKDLHLAADCSSRLVSSIWHLCERRQAFLNRSNCDSLSWQLCASCLSVWEVCVLVWVRMCVSQDLAPGQGKVWHFSAGHASVEQKVLINLFCPTFALSRRRCLFAWQRLNKCFCPDHKWFICYLCVPCWTSDGSLLGRHNQSSQTTLFNVKVNTLSQALTALGGYTHEKRNSGIKRITAC